MKEDLKNFATKNVKFQGHVHDMEAAWKSIDILCTPSRKEGLPMASLEAMTFGVPVLAYGAGALPKLIDHNVNGWLIDLPHEKEICTSDMEKILRAITITQARSCGAQARETVKGSYSQQALIPEFLKIYNLYVEDIDANTEGAAHATS